MDNQITLIIIDVQNDYFEGGANPLQGSFEAALKAKEILGNFRAKKLPVVHVRHLSIRPGSTFFLPDTPGADFHPLVHPLENEKIVTKNFPNSFRDTDLLQYLQTHGIKNLVFCGMMTHVCIDATVRAARDLGFGCTLLSDACATKDLIFNAEKIPANHVYAAFLAALNYYYATVHKVDEYLTKMQDTGL